MTAMRWPARIALLATGLLAACGGPEAPPAPPPPLVEVETVKTGTVPNVVELPGRIEAVRMAEVRARTDGIIERRLYEEGSFVAAGTPLFRIDPRDYQAQVQSAQAALDRANAARVNAAQVVSRYQPLVSEQAVSAQEFDSARSTLRQAEAQVSEARAALSRAQLQLSYTTVRAPISGRVGRADVTEGALVSASQSTPLTRIDQVTPVYAVFTVSSAQILDTLEQQRSGDLRLPALDQLGVQLILENDAIYGARGELDFASATVAPDTGTQILRARFPNPAGMLKPGEFVRGRIEAGVVRNGITVPSRAVQFRGEEALVYVIAADGTAVSRTVQLGELLGNRWIVQSGLRAGERLIVDGWQRARPGQKVQIRPANAEAGGKADAKAGS